LSPDIEADLRAEAAARGMDVGALITNAVQADLPETATTVNTIRVPSRDRSAEMAWASSPDSRFFGKWVVLEGRQVVASGSNPKQLYEEVRARGLSSPFLIFVSPEEHAPFGGGWIDRLSSLDFDADFAHEKNDAGILVPVRLNHRGRSVELSARLDTGAADCLFDRFYADIRGLPDAGLERSYRTVTGSFQAFGHEVMIETLGLR
jgi:hypothetical protein